MAYYLALDIGGTNLKAGLVKPDGELIRKLSCPTLADRRTGQEIIEACLGLCEQLIEAEQVAEADLAAIGVGAPGTVDDTYGELRKASNLDLNNLAARSLIQARFNCPVHLVNDANAAALAEAVVGAGRGVADSVLITIGTGIGGGVVIDGKLYSGFNDAAAELGHHVIVVGGRECTCGRRGCMERYCSAAALVRDTEQAIRDFPDSILAQIASDDGEVDGKTSFKALDQNCPVAKQLLANYLDYLADGLGNVINFLMPELLILGGGLSAQAEFLLNGLNQRLPSRSFSQATREKTRLVIAELGNDAGLVGAALFAKQKTDQRD